MEPARELPTPMETAIFLGGRATDEDDRLSKAVLRLRPGVLIIAACG